MNARIPLLCGTAFAAVIYLLSSCKDKSTPEEPFLRADRENLTLEPGLSSGTITITTNQNWNFEIAPDAALWCKAVKDGEKLTVTATDYNRSEAARTAAITITAGEKPNIMTIPITVIQPGAGNQAAKLLARQAWYDSYPSDVSGSKTSVASNAMKLEFFGWGPDKDHKFTLDFPADPSQYKRAILKYRMGTWAQGASPWDITTAIRVQDKATGKWHELTRAFTPYGNTFGSSWEKYFYFDVTDYLPMLHGATEFRIYYDGFDATDTRAHTVTLTFDLYEGAADRNMIYTANIYDSETNDNTSYRKWAYGFANQDIESVERLGLRRFAVPAGVKSMEMKVTITGHGHDKGQFSDRAGYATRNAAEFDENTYTVKVNGNTAAYPGRIFTTCQNNYQQAGTYQTDRANWCPGNPAIVHYWQITDVPEGGGELTLDLDLERFVSQFKAPSDSDGSARYMITADLFGFDK